MWTCRIGLAVVLCLVWASISASHADSVALTSLIVAGARVHVITVDLNDPRVTVDVAIPEKGLSHSESFVRLVARHSPVAAVTGTYFDTRTLLPVGSIISGGRTLHKSAIGTAVCFSRDAGVRCVTASVQNTTVSDARSYAVKFLDKRKGEPCDWTGVEFGIRTGPRLLTSGQYALNAGAEGFRHPGLFGRHLRMVLGITARNKLLLVAVRKPVSFATTASIMKALAATDAVCLDGGSSSAMFYRGRVICQPGRALTNIVAVHRNTAIIPNVASLPATTHLGTVQATREGPVPVFRRLFLPARFAQEESRAYAVLVDPAELGRVHSRRNLARLDLAGAKHSHRRVCAGHITHVGMDSQLARCAS